MKTKPEKYVTEKTFERHMQAIAKSFDRHEKVLEKILERLELMNEDNKYFRQSVGTLYSDTSSHDRKIDRLTMRVDRLEAKIKQASESTNTSRDK